MSHDLHELLRERLEEHAEPVAADEAWRTRVINRLEPVRIRHRRARVAQAGIAATAAAVGLVAGVTLGLAQGGSGPTPAPNPSESTPAPSDTNRGVIDRMPEGDAAGVVVVDASGMALLPDGSSVDVGRAEVLGRHQREVIVRPRNGSTPILLPSGRTVGGEVLSPDGSLLWTYDGKVLDVDTGGVVATTEPFPDGAHDYFHSTATWTRSGVVVSAAYNAAFGEAGWQHLLIPADRTRIGGLAGGWVEIDWPAGGDSRDPVFARESDRVLLQQRGQCAFVGRLDGGGALTPVREICDAVLGLSPDGSTVLTGIEGAFAGGPARSVAGLVDVDTGEVTELSGLAAVDDFDQNVLDTAWEDGDTVLLAYLVEILPAAPSEGDVGEVEERPFAVVRLVRCSVGESECEAVPGEVRTDTAAPDVFTMYGVGE